MAHHGWVPEVDRATLTPSGLKSPFGRLFEASNHSYNSHAISMLAGADGPMVEPADYVSTKPALPTGFTFLGQFIDHDLTEFRVLDSENKIVPSNPSIGQRQRVLEDGNPNCTNGRLGILDLDCVYGLLGVAEPALYSDTGAFWFNGDDGDGPDFARGGGYRHGRLIADPRNDENKLIAQIHMLFQRLHNKEHAPKSAQPKSSLRPGGEAFQATKLAVQNAYRRIVLCDYLPRLVQGKHIAAVLSTLTSGESFFQRMNRRALAAFIEQLDSSLLDSKASVPGNEAELVSGSASGKKADKTNEPGLVAMPVEFAQAVFRLGHSQLRQLYDLSATRQGAKLFGVPGEDLRGDAPLVPDAPATDFLVDWSYFFELPGGNTRQGRALDGFLPRAVFRLPHPAIGEPPVSLAERNIRRGVDFGLPSGQEAASYLSSLYGGIEGLTRNQLFPAFGKDQFDEILAIDGSIGWATPLWYYILREAEAIGPGEHLGPVGGLIVAETILGGLDCTDKGEFDLVAEHKKCAIPPNDAPQSIDEIRTMSGLIQYLKG